MKTKDFIERAEGLGYSIFHPEEGLMRIEKNRLTSCEYYATVSIYEAYKLDLNFIDFINMSNSEKGPLFNLIVQYARTPLEERVEEKEYVYRMNCAVVAQEYLKATKKGVVRFEGDRDFSTNEPYFKSKFTDAEVESYPEVVRELFKICEKIEVTP